MAGPYIDNQSGNWSTVGIWTPNGRPVAGEIVQLVGDWIVTAAVAEACGTIQILGGGVNALVIDADLTLGAGGMVGNQSVGYFDITGGSDVYCAGSYSASFSEDWTGFTGTLIFNHGAGAFTFDPFGQVFADIEIDNAATTFVLQDDLECADLTISGGKIDFDGNDLEVHGDLIYAAGTVGVPAAATITGAGAHDVEWNTTNLPNLILGADVDVTASETIQLSKLTGPSTATLTVAGGKMLYFYRPADNFWDYQGSCGGFFFKIYNNQAVRSTGRAIVLDDMIFEYRASNDTYTLLLDGDLDVGIASGYMIAFKNSATGRGVIDANGHNITAYELVAGEAAANNKNGEYQFGTGYHTIGAGGMHPGNDANEDNLFALGAGTFALAGTFDSKVGAGTHPAAVTSSHARFLSGTLQNIDVGGDNRIIAWGCVVTDCGIGVEAGPRVSAMMPMAMPLAPALAMS